MKEVMQERPDLARAKFDFVSENGAIKVVSDAMSEEDIAWLEGKLNDDFALVASVEKFHEHMVGIFVNHAKGYGKPLSEEQVVQANKQVDGMVRFMGFMGDLASAVQRGVNNARRRRLRGRGRQQGSGPDAGPYQRGGFRQLHGGRRVDGQPGHHLRIPQRQDRCTVDLDAFLKAGSALSSFLPDTAPASLGFHAQA